MKILLQDIKSAEQAMTKILMTPMEFKLSYNIERILDKVVSQIKVMEDFRLKLVEKYGSKDKDNKLIVKPEKYDAFDKEYRKYLSHESDIDIRMIPFELLEKANIKLSPADMISLKKFIAEPLPEVIKIKQG